MEIDQDDNEQVLTGSLTRKSKKCRKFSCVSEKKKLSNRVKILKRQLHNLQLKIKLRTRERDEKQRQLVTTVKQLNSIKEEQKKSPKLKLENIKDSDSLHCIAYGLTQLFLFQMGIG